MVPFGTMIHGVENANCESRQMVKSGWSKTMEEIVMDPVAGKPTTAKDPSCLAHSKTRSLSNGITITIFKHGLKMLTQLQSCMVILHISLKR